MYILTPYGLAWVTGWGTTSEGGKQASVLQELELGIVDDQTCYDAMTGALGTYWGWVEKVLCPHGLILFLDKHSRLNRFVREERLAKMDAR